MRAPPNHCPNHEQFMPVKEGAYMAGISVAMLYQWIRSDKPPPFVRRGRKVLLPRAEFTAWANQRTT